MTASGFSVPLLRWVLVALLSLFVQGGSLEAPPWPSSAHVSSPAVQGVTWEQVTQSPRALHPEVKPASGENDWVSCWTSPQAGADREPPSLRGARFRELGSSPLVTRNHPFCQAGRFRPPARAPPVA